MNPFLLAILRSVAVRIVGMIAAALLAADLMTPEQFEAIRDSGVTLVLSLLITVGTIVYGIVKNYFERRKLNATLRLAGTSEKEIDQYLRLERAPSVTTPKNEVPK